MNKNDIIEIARKAASLPRDFYAVGTLSIFDLLKRSGYFSEHDTIGLSELEDALSSRKELLSAWFSYSENKRSGDGWYLVTDEGKYFVGHLKRGEKTSFSDKVKAVAFFAKQELESIRNSRCLT